MAPVMHDVEKGHRPDVCNVGSCISDAKEFFSACTYAVETTGLTIVEASCGHAVIGARIERRHLNADGNVMGGMLLTMADFAASVADYDPRDVGVTVDLSLQFVSSSRGSRLIATADAVKRGRTMGF